MTDGMKVQYGSRITLLMEVLVEAVHKLVNFAFLCEPSCALHAQGIDPVVYLTF